MERLIVRPIRHADVLNLIIVTIGASILIKGGVMVSLGKNAAGLPAFTGERPIHVLGATFVPQALWIVGVACAIVVVLHLFFDRTLLAGGRILQSSLVQETLCHKHVSFLGYAY